MKQKISILIFALVALLSVQSAMAWAGYAHGAINYIAEQHLTPKAKAECRRYLKHTLYWDAAWMDHWRSVEPYQYTDKLHSFRATADGGINWKVLKGGAAGLVERSIDNLKDGKYKSMSDSLVRHNLLMIIHALPDMHCPVHVAFSKKEFPEYSYSLRKNGKKSGKHGFWDASPAFNRKDWTYEEFAANVDKVKPKAVKKLVRGGIDSWGRDCVLGAHKAHSITTENKDIAALTPKEQKAVLKLADDMAIKAAYRLAYVLNEIFR